MKFGVKVVFLTQYSIIPKENVLILALTNWIFTEVRLKLI